MDTGFSFWTGLESALKARGHTGLVNAIGIDPATRERLGAADPRDQGSPLAIKLGWYNRPLGRHLWFCGR